MPSKSKDDINILDMKGTKEILVYIFKRLEGVTNKEIREIKDEKGEKLYSTNQSIKVRDTLHEMKLIKLIDKVGVNTYTLTEKGKEIAKLAKDILEKERKIQEKIYNSSEEEEDNNNFG
ncbi:MAG: hypothetical protein GF364_14555 [Candidatus Lokiarchaeota archaeon]|nr:hypothetical protein [Candidatus Lokiarchaeota archaeon]